MAIIDDLIVAMKFDNKQFEAAVKMSVATLTHLKGNLNFGGAPNGIDAAQKSVAGFSAAPMNAQIDGISAKFLAMSTVGITALSNITNRMVDAGMAMGKSLTVTPIMEGFQEYETKIGSIQTILSNTSSDYANHEEGLADVTKNLDELNSYADKTIYSFGDMTKNIGLFTNAGIGVGDATKMIQGFSNEAASSGTTAEGAAGAAYQLSQALSAGVITLMDWKSLTNVGMGNANMKDGIIQIAEAMGAFEGSVVTAEEASTDFNGTLEKKWLSADIMENYLKIQAEGNKDVSREMMKQIGLSDEQITKFQKQQETSEDAATKVRTWSGLIGTVRESIGSSWAGIFDIVLGDFDSATTLFTGINNVIGDNIGKFADGKKQLLSGWAEMGGRDMMLDGLKNVFEGIMSIMNPIKDAFREIFPPTSVRSLLQMTAAFQAFSTKLKVGGETADKIKRTFAGVFAIFGIAVSIIKGVASGIASLFGAFSGGSGGVLSLTASIGDFLVKLHETIKSSDIFGRIFRTIGTVLQAPIEAIGTMAAGVGAFIVGLGQLASTAEMAFGILFKGDFSKGGGIFEEDSKVVDVLFRMREAMEWVTGAASQLFNVLFKGDFTGGPFEEDSGFIDGLFKLRDALSNFFTPGNIAKVLGAAAAGVLAVGIGVVIKNAIGSLTGKKGGIFGELKDAFTSIKDAFGNVADLFDTLTGSLKVMQQDIKVNMILKIAIAVGILAVAMALLSTLSVADLGKSLGAITVAMVQLVGALAVVSKIAGAPGIVQMPIIALGLIGFAAAIVVLALAMKILATMSWEEFGKGIAGVASLLTLLVAASYGLGKASGPMLRAGLAMIPLALGLMILVKVMKDLAEMSWAEFGEGIAGLASIMAILAISLNLMPKNMPVIGAGLILIGAGLMVITFALKQIAKMSWAELGEGIAGLASMLVVMGLALHLMPKNMISIGAGLILVSIALLAITAAIKSMGNMSWNELVKGMVGLGVSLGLLAIGLRLMQTAMPGALAMMVAAVALNLLLIPIQAFANMSWAELLMGLGGLAGVLTILGLAGYLLAPVAPIIVAIGLGMLSLGIGLMAVGAAALIFAMAFKAILELVMMGPAAITALVTAIPQIAAAFALAIVAFITTIASNAVAIAAAFARLLGSLLDAVTALIPKIAAVVGALLTAILNLIIEYAPQIGEAFKTVLRTLLDIIVTMIPEIVTAALQLITDFLNAIAEGVPGVAQKATDIVVAFLGAIGDNLPRIIQAGFQLIVDFVNGLANAIRENTQPLIDAAKNLGKAIIDGIVLAIKEGISSVIGAAKDMAKSALDAAKDFLKINSPSKRFIEVGKGIPEGLVIGIQSGDSAAAQAGNKLATGVFHGFSKGVGKEMPKALDKIYEQLEKGFGDVKFQAGQTGLSRSFTTLGNEIWKAELAIASFYGEVNMADPASIEAYVEKAGGKLQYLAGVFDGLKESANLAFGMMAEGMTLDKVLGNEDFLTSILRTGLAIIPGIEGTLISAGVFLALAVVDGILSIFMGPGHTVIGTIGKWITKLVRAVGGWFGIKFPVEEELAESDKALEDFMATVDDGHGRFEKLTEEAVKGLKDSLDGADDLADGIENTDPKVTPVLDLVQWDKDIDKFLDSLDVGPVVLNKIINGASDLFDATVSNLRGLFNRDVEEAQGNTTIALTQYNNSPKALDHVEVYRQTKSQLSLAKEALGVT